MRFYISSLSQRDLILQQPLFKTCWFQKHLTHPYLQMNSICFKTLSLFFFTFITRQSNWSMYLLHPFPSPTQVICISTHSTSSTSFSLSSQSSWIRYHYIRSSWILIKVRFKKKKNIQIFIFHSLSLSIHKPHTIIFFFLFSKL